MQGPKRWRVTNVAGFLETLITAAALALGALKLKRRTLRGWSPKGS
jgi:hypothetical protein